MTFLPAIPANVVALRIADMTREDALAECQRIDANGCYLDDLGAADGFEPMTEREALEALAELYSYDNCGNDPEGVAVRRAVAARTGVTA